ncbi:GPW/gp25 family protein [Ideonella sp. DXS22W]|uniref:GPW/gp25 family protein n=1 Tax=Pseudaquabacterium inlustre TaxID=2984192 RepID=A0ABU9CEL4_9BURK
MAGADLFLGQGWAFPPRFAAGGAGVALVSGTDDVAESLAILLATRRGERVLAEDYGCDLAEFMFAEITPALVGQVHDLVADAVLEFEPRVVLNGVSVSTERASEGVLAVAIDYTVRATNSRFNMVWPFYLDEAVRPLGAGG